MKTKSGEALDGRVLGNTESADLGLRRRTLGPGPDASRSLAGLFGGLRSDKGGRLRISRRKALWARSAALRPSCVCPILVVRRRCNDVLGNLHLSEAGAWTWAREGPVGLTTAPVPDRLRCDLGRRAHAKVHEIG